MFESLDKESECTPGCEKLSLQPIVSFMGFHADTMREVIKTDPPKFQVILTLKIDEKFSQL